MLTSLSVPVITAMARVQVADVVTTSSGTPAVGVAVSIVPHGGGTAIIYQQESGGGTISALFTDTTGSFAVWLDEGRYDITIAGQTRTIEVINQGTVAIVLARPYTTEGLASALPGFGVVGRTYFTTDTNLFLVDTGSAWVTINPPAGTPLTGSSAFGGDVTGTYTTIQVNSAASAFTANAGLIYLKNSAASANQKISRFQTVGGLTTVDSMNDAASVVIQHGVSFNHTTGVVDFPTGLTRGGQAVYAGTDVVPGSLPLGAVTDYAGSADPSASWMICDGRAVSRTTYAGLFAIVSTAYGIGDGSTTFNLPDSRGRVSAGTDNPGTGTGAANRLHAQTLGAVTNQNTLAGVGGEDAHTLLIAELAAHNHPAEIDVRGATGETSVTGGIRPLATTGVQTGANSQVNTTNTGSGSAHNNMPPYLVLNKIVRVL